MIYNFLYISVFEFYILFKNSLWIFPQLNIKKIPHKATLINEKLHPLLHDCFFFITIYQCDFQSINLSLKVCGL